MEMTQAERMALAVRTLAPVTPELRKRINQETVNEIVSIFVSAANMGRAADIQKRMVFYGKKQDKPLEMRSFPEIKVKLMESRLTNSDDTIQLLHAVTGLITEIGEMSEGILDIIEDKPDPVNFQEECGDLDWYLQVLCHILKTSLDQIQAVNVAKLQKRYPQKFTEEAAVNRDLQGERRVLENHPGVSDKDLPSDFAGV